MFELTNGLYKSFLSKEIKIWFELAKVRISGVRINSAGPYVINPACHVYFIGIDFSYTEFNEEFKYRCLKKFPKFKHCQLCR